MNMPLITMVLILLLLLLLLILPIAYLLNTVMSTISINNYNKKDHLHIAAPGSEHFTELRPLIILDHLKDFSELKPKSSLPFKFLFVVSLVSDAIDDDKFL